MLIADLPPVGDWGVVIQPNRHQQSQAKKSLVRADTQALIDLSVSAKSVLELEIQFMAWSRAYELKQHMDTKFNKADRCRYGVTAPEIRNIIAKKFQKFTPMSEVTERPLHNNGDHSHSGAATKQEDPNHETSKKKETSSDPSAKSKQKTLSCDKPEGRAKKSDGDAGRQKPKPNHANAADVRTPSKKRGPAKRFVERR